jgi:hypothetical protein
MVWDAEFLAEASRVLFGAVDAAGLSAILGVGERTIRRWLAGTETPRDPAAVLTWLQHSVDARASLAYDVSRAIAAASLSAVDRPAFWRLVGEGLEPDEAARQAHALPNEAAHREAAE